MSEETYTGDIMTINYDEAIAELELTSLRNQLQLLQAALRRFHNPEDCGDHCSNFCPQCQATQALSTGKETA